MAIFNITNDKGILTNIIDISTLTGSACPSVVNQIIDNIAYKSGAPGNLLLGETIYSDINLTTLYNLTGIEQGYNILVNGIDTKISIDINSIYITTICI